jgi:hypothetical protein
VTTRPIGGNGRGSPPPLSTGDSGTEAAGAEPAGHTLHVSRPPAAAGRRPSTLPLRRRGSAPGAPEIARPELVELHPAPAGDPEHVELSESQTLAARLDAIPFSAEALDHIAEQRAMEVEYLAWATEQLQVRKTAFGEHGYSLFKASPPTLFMDASLSIAFDAFAAGLKSSLRSPVRAAVAAGLDQELTHKYDVTVLSGLASAMPATLAAQVVIPALQSRAKASNLQRLIPVDPKVLFPDPGPVVLQVASEDGVRTKCYLRPIEVHDLPADIAEQGGTDRPSRQNLKAEVTKQRDQLTLWQATLSGTRGGTLTKPAMTGALSALRRYLSSDPMLVTASGVFGGSVMSSFGASALTEALQGIAKSVPRVSAVSIDDMLGGKQRVNSFKLVRPTADQPAAGWSDVAYAPAFVVDSLREMAALASHALLPDWRATTPADKRPDWNIVATAHHLLGIATANAFAAVCGDASGPYFAQVVRGRDAGQTAGESLRSAGNIAQQFASSGMNELLWGNLSGENGFGALNAPQAKALEEFRERVVVNRKRTMTDNNHRIAELQEQFTNAWEDPTTPAETLMTLAASIAGLERKNERLLAGIRRVSAWSKKTIHQRAVSRAPAAVSPQEE